VCVCVCVCARVCVYVCVMLYSTINLTVARVCRKESRVELIISQEGVPVRVPVGQRQEGTRLEEAIRKGEWSVVEKMFVDLIL